MSEYEDEVGEGLRSDDMNDPDLGRGDSLSKLWDDHVRLASSGKAFQKADGSTASHPLTGELLYDGDLVGGWSGHRVGSLSAGALYNRPGGGQRDPETFTPKTAMSQRHAHRHHYSALFLRHFPHSLHIQEFARLLDVRAPHGAKNPSEAPRLTFTVDLRVGLGA